MSVRPELAALAVVVLVVATTEAGAAQQPQPASAPDTAEGMSRATDTSSTITPGAETPADTAQH